MAVGSSPLPEGVLLLGMSQSGLMTSVAVEAAAQNAKFSISVCSCLTPRISLSACLTWAYSDRVLKVGLVACRMSYTTSPYCIEVTLGSQNRSVCRTVFCGVQ